MFREQAKNGAVLITHADMTRYLITLRQAVDLVHGAIELQQGGEIFLPQLKSIRITDLARAIAPEAEQVIVGLRPGEKIHEVLFTAEESKRIHINASFTVINPEYATWKYEPWSLTDEPLSLNSDQTIKFSQDELEALVNAE
jgi:UDP-N-acetylglucosamine 4,6-dehydratase